MDFRICLPSVARRAKDGFEIWCLIFVILTSPLATRNPQRVYPELFEGQHVTRNSQHELFNQFESIMQNKPNLLNALMNVNTIITKHYENKRLSRRRENKPNTKPIKANTNPIPKKPKMNENLFATKVYENITTFRLEQNKAKTNPIYAIGIKPNFKGKKCCSAAEIICSPMESLRTAGFCRVEFVVFSLNLAETYSDIMLWNA